MSNFDFLKESHYFEKLAKIEREIAVFPRPSMFSIRNLLEKTLLESFKAIPNLIPPRDRTIFNMLEDEEFICLLDDKKLLNKLHEIRVDANGFAHNEEYVLRLNPLEILMTLHKYMQWYADYVLELNLEYIPFNKSYTPEPTIIVETSNEDSENIQNEIDSLHIELQQAIVEINNKPKKNSQIIIYENAGFTKQINKIWGRVYVNFNYSSVAYFGVKYYAPDGGAKEKLHIGKGKFENSNLYLSFPERRNDLILNALCDGIMDHERLSIFPQEKFWKLSLYANRLKNEIPTIFEKRQRSIEALKNEEELILKMEEFNFQGKYYERNGELCRNILQITEKNTTENSLFDALAIFLNPGAGKPLSKPKVINEFNELAFLEALPCVPDLTQTQMIRLMKKMNWKKTLVINLFDLCEVSSSQVLQLLDSKKEKAELFQSSIFHVDRKAELESIKLLLAKDAPIIIGWGTEEKLENMKQKILSKLEQDISSKIVGVKKKDAQYYHPYPRGEQNENMRLNWPDMIVSELNG